MLETQLPTKHKIFKMKRKRTITTGIYRIVRHPIYSGTLILFLGLILFHSSALSFLYFPASILLYWIMTYFEEKDLIRMFGEEYLLYKQKVKSRIIPFIL
jgi:methanethiol S-methyltransferase